MICGTCGRDNQDHLVFCLECGQRLGPRIAPPTPPIGLPQPNAFVSQPPAPQSIPSAPRPSAPDFKFSGRPAPQPTEHAGDIVRCATCGAANQRGLRFCVACGNVVEPGAARPAPSVDAPPPVAGPAVEAIAPSRVVALGVPPAPPRTTSRVCARCRGLCDPGAQFCKFCGASLADAALATAQQLEPSEVTSPASPVFVPPPSAMPETPPVDHSQYRNYQAMSAASSSQPSQSAAAMPTISPPPPMQSARISPAAASVALSGATATMRGRVVIIARDGGEGPAFPLGEVTDIGRTDGNILVAEDRYISPRHARISRRGAELFLRDLGSVNGVFLRIARTRDDGGAGSVQAARIGGDDALGQVALEDQDLFLVGQQVLRFEAVRDAEEGFGAASQHGTLLFGTPAAPRYARLSQRTVEGVVRDVFYIRKAETVLGRESGDIVFTDDPFLSRRHAAIRFDSAHKRFTLEDLGSSNGTFLQIREEVRLKDGDHFRVGQQLFRVDIEGVAPAVSRS